MSKVEKNEALAEKVINQVHDAVGRTAALIRKMLDVSLLDASEHNPNEMEEAEFNLLYDNIGRMGVTDPILVRPNPDKPGRYKIVGGHHRVEVAKLHDMQEVPCTIIMDPDFDEDTEKFQMVRHNLIHGKMSAKKFTALYEGLSGKYSEEIAAELFGFTSEEEFKKMVKSTAKSLPKEMQKTFLDAAKEIKTVNDLSLVLNRLFTSFGDTVPHGYMMFDFGGQDHVWVRMSSKSKQHLMNLGNYCRSYNRTIESAIVPLLQLIAQGELSQEAFEDMFLKAPEIDTSNLSKGEPPTEDNLEAAAKLKALM